MVLPAEISELLANEESKFDSEEEILNKLLDESDLDTKTDLAKPIRWTALSIIAGYLKDKNLANSELILSKFIDIAFKYLISKDRMGRKEYIEALKSVRENNQTQLQNSALSMNVGAPK